MGGWALKKLVLSVVSSLPVPRRRSVQLPNLDVQLLLCEVWLGLTVVSGTFWTMLTLLSAVVMS